MTEQNVGLKLPSLISNIEIKQEDGLVRLTADYSPLLHHSESFCNMTKDRNPIHKAHPEYGEAVSPGFLQTSAAAILIREVINQKGINPKDYPFLHTNVELKKPVLTGCNYKFEIESNPSNAGSLKFSAKIKDQKGSVVCNMHREYSKAEPVLFFPSINSSYLVHTGIFTGDDVLNFGNLVGSESPESNLYALSGSSSVVFDAVEKGKLSPLLEGIVALYASQNIHSDSSSTLDLRRGISLELYLSNPDRFGKLSEADEVLDMKILARTSKGKFIYLSQSPISFQNSRLLDIIIRKELRNRVA